MAQRARPEGGVAREEQTGSRSLSVNSPRDLPWVAMVPGGGPEVPVIACEVQRLGGGILTFRRLEDLVHNRPSGRLAVVVLDGHEDLDRLEQSLAWLREQRPRCSAVVVTDHGGGKCEQVARAGGALVLLRPVSAASWSAVLRHAIAGPVVQAGEAGAEDHDARPRPETGAKDEDAAQAS